MIVSGYFRLEVKNINRSTRNIIACASYRSDEKLYSERTDENIKFANHSQKPESFIITPNHAPDWASNREKLWNEVDKKERSVQENSRVAREVILSLPNDLDYKLNKEIVKNFVQDEFVNQGMVADISIHTDDINNPHAHVLLTTRPFKENGEWGAKRKSNYVFDENGEHVLTKSGNKKRESVHAFDFNNQYIKDIRKSYSNILNEYSKRAGINKEYSSESFENQGRKELPLKRLTREEYYLEKKEKERCNQQGIDYVPVTFYGKINKEIEEYNQGIINNLEQNLDDKVMKINDLIRDHKSDITVDKESFKIITKRNKGFVNYESAKKIYKSLHPTASKYGRSLMAEKDRLKFRKDYLINLENSFNSNSNSVKKFGYEPKTFEKDIVNEVDKLKNDVQSYKAKKEKYNELYGASKEVYSYFIKSNREIYNHIFKDNNIEYYQHNDDSINLYLNNIKNGNYIDITEISGLKYEDNDMQNLKNFDLYSILSKEINFAKKDIQKATLNLKEEYNKEDVLELNFRVKEYNEKLEQLNDYKHHIDDDLQRAFKEKNLSYNDLDSLSMFNKIKMIEQATSNNNTYSDEQIFNHFSNKNQEFDQQAEDIIESFEYSEFNVVNQSISSLSDSVFNSLSSAVHDIDNQTKYKDLYNKRKKNGTMYER